MKKTFFLFALLASSAASAQSHINIEMLSAMYANTPAVKFRVSWSSIPIVTGQTHNAKVWLWIDFLKLNANNTTSGNTWTRAEISETPTVISSPTSAATLDASTNKGFWLNGVPGSYSATVTVSLANIPANTKFDWCAYVSDCPPNIGDYNNGTYTLRGTPPFTLKDASGITQTVTGKTFVQSSFIPITMTDATSCPGYFCKYAGDDLYVDAQHKCDLRTTGAKNWEAWIKDARDNEPYRIVLMPDDKWWLAQNLRFTNGLSFQLASANPNGGLGAYWCYTNAVAGCSDQNRGALYTWETMMMVDGKYNAEGKSGSADTWNETWVSSQYCTGTPADDVNCQKNVARGNVIAYGGGRGICPLWWHVPTTYEAAYMLDVTGNSGSSFRNNTPTGAQKINMFNLLFATTGWANTVGSDTYGFTAYPAGIREWNGNISRTSSITMLAHSGAMDIIRTHIIHCVTDYSYTSAELMMTSRRANNASNGSYPQGISVRCVR
ncbi:MAG: hypothetical protein LBF81_04120 [Prevotellaceae bacterium]|nr:hypothetical protein [Prevotellaceae bacterium]